MFKPTLKGKSVLSSLIACAALTLCMSTSANAALINHWAFEGGGNAQPDSGTSGNILTLQNGGIDNTEFAPVGSTSSLRLDRTTGVNDGGIAMGYKAPLVGNANSRTLAAWVKSGPNPRSNNNMAILSYGSNQNSRKFIMRANNSNGETGNLRVEVNGGYITSADTIVDGQWHHVAMTFEDDGTPNVADVLLYVDGVLQTPDFINTNLLNTNPAGNDFRVGDGHNNQDRWDGWIDDVRVYDEVLSAEGIRNLFTGAGAGVPEPSTALLGLLGMAGFVARRRRSAK